MCGLSGAVPMGHMAFYVDKKFFHVFDIYLWALGGALYIGGAIIYMLKIPERFLPRKFDIIVSYCYNLCLNFFFFCRVLLIRFFTFS
jgi:predicted membrane channel-forming protein YqfA (hemolysin III family)